MPETVVAPDVEAVVITYLNAALTPPVSSQVPNPRPDDFVRVTLSGGAGFTPKALYQATVTVEAWGATRPAAGNLARLALAHLEAAATFYAEADAPRYFPDDTGHHRYLAAAQIWTRGAPI